MGFCIFSLITYWNLKKKLKQMSNPLRPTLRSRFVENLNSPLMSLEQWNIHSLPFLFSPLRNFVAANQMKITFSMYASSAQVLAAAHVLSTSLKAANVYYSSTNPSSLATKSAAIPSTQQLNITSKRWVSYKRFSLK